MAHVSDPSVWWHEDSTGAFGPECDPSRASICSRVDVARACPRSLAEMIAEWVRDEGRPFRGDPNLPAPSPELRARLASIRRALASFGLNIRRDRGRRWWYLYRVPPDRYSRLDFQAPLRDLTLQEQAQLEQDRRRASFLTRAREIVMKRKGARRRIRFDDAVEAVLDGIEAGLDDEIPF